MLVLRWTVLLSRLDPPLLLTNSWPAVCCFLRTFGSDLLCTGASEVQRCSKTVTLLHSDNLSTAALVGTVCVKIVEEMKLRLVYSSILTAAIFSNEWEAAAQDWRLPSLCERARVRNTRLFHAGVFHTTVPFCSCFTVLHWFAWRDLHELRKEVSRQAALRGARVCDEVPFAAAHVLLLWVKVCDCAFHLVCCLSVRSPPPYPQQTAGSSHCYENRTNILWVWVCASASVCFCECVLLWVCTCTAIGNKAMME